MRQWLSLLALAALLAGCATGPQPATSPSQPESAASQGMTGSGLNEAGETAGNPAAASSSDGAVNPDAPESSDGASNPHTPSSSDRADSPGTPTPNVDGAGSVPTPDAPPSVGSPTPPAQPPAQTEPAIPSASDLLSGLVRVPTPALADLPAALQQHVSQLSPWAAAEQATVWRHGAQVVDPLAVAPALAGQLAPLSGSAPDQVWTKLISSWGEGDRFYFHLQMTRRDADGRMVRAGIDVVEVSQLEGGEPIVTGYAHAPWTADPNQGDVSVWVGRSPNSYISPKPVHLPAPVVLDAAGRYQVPVAALEALGTVQWLGDGSVSLPLAPGSSSAAMATTTIGGVPYVAIDDLIAAIDGRHYSSAEGSYTYAVEWRPDLGQLCLWQDEQHPIS